MRVLLKVQFNLDWSIVKYSSIRTVLSSWRMWSLEFVTCGNRYYTADILHTVHQIATGKPKPEHTESIPVAHLAVQGMAAAS